MELTYRTIPFSFNNYFRFLSLPIMYFKVLKLRRDISALEKLAEIHLTKSHTLMIAIWALSVYVRMPIRKYTPRLLKQSQEIFETRKLMLNNVITARYNSKVFHLKNHKHFKV